MGDEQQQTWAAWTRVAKFVRACHAEYCSTRVHCPRSSGSLAHKSLHQQEQFFHNSRPNARRRRHVGISDISPTCHGSERACDRARASERWPDHAITREVGTVSPSRSWRCHTPVHRAFCISSAEHQHLRPVAQAQGSCTVPVPVPHREACLRTREGEGKGGGQTESVCKRV